MKIVIEKLTNKAIYLFTDFEPIAITETGMKTSTTRALDIRSSTHEVVTGDAPEFWVSGALSYNGTWSVLSAEQYQKAVDKKAAAIKAVAVKAAQEEFKAAVSEIESAYSREERETWAQQVAEAKAIKKNGTELTPMLDAILSERPDLTKQELIDRIEANAAAYSLISGKALGKMQKKIADLESNP